MRLNKEQQKIVEENHNLIYQYLIDNKLPQDEYYGIAAIGLCKAALKFDKNTGISFSTYAYSTIRNTITSAYRTDKKDNVETLSSNNIYAYKDDFEEFINLFESNDDIENKVIAVSHFEWFIENMSNKQLKICICKLYNMTDEDIGKIFNVTHSSINNIWRKIKKDFVSNNRPNDYKKMKKNDNIIEREMLKEKLLDIIETLV